MRNLLKTKVLFVIKQLKTVFHNLIIFLVLRYYHLFDRCAFRQGIKYTAKQWDSFIYQALRIYFLDGLKKLFEINFENRPLLI